MAVHHVINLSAKLLDLSRLLLTHYFSSTGTMDKVGYAIEYDSDLYEFLNKLSIKHGDPSIQPKLIDDDLMMINELTAMKYCSDSLNDILNDILRWE